MINQEHSNRYHIIGAALTAAGLFIFVWIIRIQTSQSAKEILEKGQKYTYIPKTIYPERGNIYDRWGRLLAGNTEVYEVGVDLEYLIDPQTVAMTASTHFGWDYEVIYPLLDPEMRPAGSRYVQLSTSATPEKIAEIESTQKQLRDQRADAPKKVAEKLPSLEGLVWSAHLQRSYPEHSLASNILGFYSYLDRENGRGFFGVEEKYNHLLAGTPVKILVPQDPYLIDKPPSIPPGVSLVLTIDREIQAMVEQVLDESVESSGSESGTIIVMDPRNGEILAMASTPRMDPNEYWKYKDVFPAPTPYNRAVGQTYEPGSVFKVLTMAAAIDSGAVPLDYEYVDTGVIEVGGIPIYNWDRGAWGLQNLTGCMQHSLNVCLAGLAVQMGPTSFYNYMLGFGIGHRTGVDLAGEVNLPLSIAGDPYWYPVNLGTNSFGQGLATTPVQMITAISAVANNQGKMMAPHVLRSVIENGEQFTNPAQIIGSPISAESARTLSEMLAVSLEEESSDALVEGYRVAGKTGTGEIPTPQGYTTGMTNASFVGWGPVDDPRFIVYVWLEKPQSSQWGSIVAAPVFSEVVSKLVILLDLPPDDIRMQLASR